MSAADVATALAASYIDRIEIRTTASPPVIWTGDEIRASIAGNKTGAQAEEDSAVLSFLRPTIILDSETWGKTVWAPYGVASPEAWRQTQRNTYFLLFGAAAGLFGLGYYLGKRRRK